jgi:hypothetical protein
VKPDFQSILAEADQSYLETGDRLEALVWIAFAAKNSLPIPPSVATWLSSGIREYLDGNVKSMDRALGLLSPEQKDGRVGLRKRGAMQLAMAKMFVLHVAGATIDDAATLVSAITPGYTVNTLFGRYSHSGLGRKALASRLCRPWGRYEIEELLKEYPEAPLAVRQAKAVIRKVYSHR